MKLIEKNPLRFGGKCTTRGFSWYDCSFNSNHYFIQNKKTDWEEIFKNDEEEIYSLVLLNKASGFQPLEISQFDFDKLKQDLEHILVIRTFDFNKYPAFGLLFTETRKGNKRKLNDILHSNLSKYVVLKR